MPVPHAWTECQPALILEASTEPDVLALADANLRRAWTRVTDVQRRHFHDFTCENDRSELAVLAMHEIEDILRQEGLA